MTERRAPVYVLNRNEGRDTLHMDPIEECNVDDALDREYVDQATYEAMKAQGHARVCRHCQPVEDPIT